MPDTERPNTSPIVTREQIQLRARQTSGFLRGVPRKIAGVLIPALLTFGALRWIWTSATNSNQVIIGLVAGGIGYTVLSIVEYGYRLYQARADILTQRIVNANTYSRKLEERIRELEHINARSKSVLPSLEVRRHSLRKWVRAAHANDSQSLFWLSEVVPKEENYVDYIEALEDWAKHATEEIEIRKKEQMPDLRTNIYFIVKRRW